MPAKNIRNKRKCRHKIAYATREAAEIIVERMYTERNRRYPKNIRSRLSVIHSYRCQFCKMWHIGNRLKN